MNTKKTLLYFFVRRHFIITLKLSEMLKNFRDKSTTLCALVFPIFLRYLRQRFSPDLACLTQKWFFRGTNTSCSDSKRAKMLKKKQLLIYIIYVYILILSLLLWRCWRVRVISTTFRGCARKRRARRLDCTISTRDQTFFFFCFRTYNFIRFVFNGRPTIDKPHTNYFEIQTTLVYLNCITCSVCTGYVSLRSINVRNLRGVGRCNSRRSACPV